MTCWSSQTAIRVRLRECSPRRPARGDRPSGTKRGSRTKLPAAMILMAGSSGDVSCGIVGTIWEPSGRNRSNAEEGEFAISAWPTGGPAAGGVRHKSGTTRDVAEPPTGGGAPRDGQRRHSAMVALIARSTANPMTCQAVAASIEKNVFMSRAFLSGLFDQRFDLLEIGRGQLAGRDFEDRGNRLSRRFAVERTQQVLDAERLAAAGDCVGR